MIYRKRFLICTSVFVATAVAFVLLSAGFAARGQENWYSPEWSYRQALTINHTKVAEDVTYFPVLVKLQDKKQNIFQHAQADGSDILFTDSDGKTVLNYEMELYSKDTGELVAWVNVPQLSATTDTTFYIYYGSTKTAPPVSSSAVWQHDYSAVYLMNQGPQRLEVKDSATSTAITEPFNTLGISKEVSGKVGTAVTFDGRTNVVDIGGQTWGRNADVVPPFTISAWIKPDTKGGTIIAKSTALLQQWQLITNFDGTLQIKEDYTGRWRNNQSGTEETTVTPGQWQHVVVVVDKQGTPLFYKDGVSEAGNNANGTFVHRDVPAAIGARWSKQPFIFSAFKGAIDDIRISKAVRSAGWIRTEYANQAQPEVFLKVSTPQGYSIPAVTSVSQKISVQLQDIRILILAISSLLLILLLIIRVYWRIRHEAPRPSRQFSFAAPLVKTIEVHQE